MVCKELGTQHVLPVTFYSCVSSTLVTKLHVASGLREDIGWELRITLGKEQISEENGTEDSQFHDPGRILWRELGGGLSERTRSKHDDPATKTKSRAT